MQVIYKIFYNKSNNNILNIQKMGALEYASDAALLCEYENEKEKRAEELDAARLGWGTVWGHKLKQGRWQDQSRALEDAAKKSGLGAIC